MHPLIYMGTLVTLVVLASWHIWKKNRFAFFDRIMLAMAGAMLLWTLAFAGGYTPLIEEGFQCIEDVPPEEDTTDIDGLRPKLYASVFGPQPVKDNNWGRFSINKERSSSGGEQSSADLTTHGLNIQNVSLHGPKVEDLGIASTNKFTWAFAARFNGFDDFNDSDITSETLLQMPTSSPGPDNIVDISVHPKAKVEGTDSTSVGFHLTAATVIGTTDEAALPVFDPEKVYMLLVRRDGMNVRMRRYPLVPNATTGILGPHEDLIAVTGVTEGLIPSNRQVVINIAGRLNANMYAVALFDAALSDTQEATLQEYFSKRIIEAVDPSSRQPGDCPYGVDVCFNRYCAGVTDWSRPELVIDSRSECKKAIVDYCEANQTHPSCYCWNKEDTRYEGEDCKRWRAFIGAGECKQIDNLSEADIEAIKNKYNLETKSCKTKQEPEKPKTGIINYYKEDSKEDSEKTDNTDSEIKDKIKNYYKVPSTDESGKDKDKKSGSIINPYETNTESGQIDNLYKKKSKHHHTDRLENHYGRPGDLAKIDLDRLTPMHSLTFHDKWGDHKKLGTHTEPDKESKSWMESIRSFLTGDN